MGLIIQKFGGTSVADADCLLRVAGIITEAYRAGDDVVAVLSAQGDLTDRLIAMAGEIDFSPPPREMDMLLSTGEQISVALCAMAIRRMGCPAVSLTGWQAGIRTNGVHGDAAILSLSGDRIREELQNRHIVVVAGFQGVDDRGDVTTLGRGGSDTTAVALAAALQADKCQIYTDVDGIYTADPNVDRDAVKLYSITYDEMLTLVDQGAQVLHRKAVEIGKAHGVDIEVLSTFTRAPGTHVR